MSTRNMLGNGQTNSTYMNSKNKGIIMLLIAAVVVGIIGGVALITYMKPQKTTVYGYIFQVCDRCKFKGRSEFR